MRNDTFLCRIFAHYFHLKQKNHHLIKAIFDIVVFKLEKSVEFEKCPKPCAHSQSPQSKSFQVKFPIIIKVKCDRSSYHDHFMEYKSEFRHKCCKTLSGIS